MTDNEKLNLLLKKWKKKAITKQERPELHNLLESDLKFRNRVGDRWGALVEVGMIHQLKKSSKHVL
jgi:hypothetical protein